jgi:hypothetical protein
MHSKAGCLKAARAAVEEGKRYALGAHSIDPCGKVNRLTYLYLSFL